MFYLYKCIECDKVFNEWVMIQKGGNYIPMCPHCNFKYIKGIEECHHGKEETENQKTKRLDNGSPD